MLAGFWQRLVPSSLLRGRVDQNLLAEMLVAATAASALMALVSGVVVLTQAGRQLQQGSNALQHQLSASLTSYQPLHSVQRELQEATSSQAVLKALLVDQRGIVLAASNNALLGLPLQQVLQRPGHNQQILQQLFASCPSASSLLSCLNRDVVMFHGPIPWIGGEAVVAMHPYPLALEGVGRYGDRASLITVSDARPAVREALALTLIVFLAGLLPLLAGCVGLMLRLRHHLIPELLRLAQIDALSGVYNRGAFLETARELTRRARLSQQPVALAVIDVDHFKQINDTHGHDAGDRVICRVAELLRYSVRADDLVGRLGGDEFVILLQQTGETATSVLQRTLEIVRTSGIGIEASEPVTITLSIGVVSTDLGADHELEDLISAADAALYVAKDRGRNQVVNLLLEAERARSGPRSPTRIGEWQVRGT
jgi:diguanylate cyclase (GGDEF)-like protein